MKRILITTPQNIEIEYLMAPVWMRGMAMAIDALIVSIYSVFFSAMIRNTENIEALYTYVTLLIVMPVMLYQPLMEILTKGKTVGKMALGIQVISSNGNAPAAKHFVSRWITSFIEGMSLYGLLVGMFLLNQSVISYAFIFLITAGAIAAIFVWSSAKGQRIGDILADTIVVRNKPVWDVQLKDLQKIGSDAQFQPKYEAIRFYSEEDILLIKRSLDRYQEFKNEAHKAIIHELTEKVCQKLELPLPQDQVKFLRRIIKEYVLLTR